jgi:hypothetical protein
MSRNVAEQTPLRASSAGTRRSRGAAVEEQGLTAIAETVAGWKGFAIRNAGSGRSPRKRSS